MKTATLWISIPHIKLISRRPWRWVEASHRASSQKMLHRTYHIARYKMRSGGDCAALWWCAGGAGVRCILVNKKHYQSPKICVIFCKPRDHSPALCSALGTKICVACASKRSKEGDYFSVPPRCSSPLLAEETKGASSLLENIDFQPFF